MGNYGADEYPALNKIRTCAFVYNFANLDNLKCDQFSTDSSKKVYHVVKKIGSTRIRFLVEPADLPG